MDLAYKNSSMPRSMSVVNTVLDSSKPVGLHTGSIILECSACMVLDLANMSDSREKAKAARDSDLGVYLPEAHRDPSCTKKTGDAVKKQKLTRSSSYSLTQQDQLYPMREHMLNKHSARRTDDQKDDTRAKHKTKAKNVPGGGTPWPSLGAVDVAHTSMHISNETSSRSESTATSRFSFPTARLSVCDAPHNASATGGGMMQSATATDHDQLCNLVSRSIPFFIFG